MYVWSSALLRQLILEIDGDRGQRRVPKQHLHCDFELELQKRGQLCFGCLQKSII